MSTMTYTNTLTIIECGDCHIPFAIPDNLYRARLKDGRDFHCPNGHAIHYYETDNMKLRKENERLERRLANAREDQRIAEVDALTARRKAAAAKGVLTKARKRQAHGVCPCCNRTFPNVARHMASKHPNLVSEATP